MTRHAVAVAVLAAALFGAVTVEGQARAGADVLAALRRGGLVIVMRHASSPLEPPTPETANADNVRGERQLDAAGRAAAARMGEALRALRVPIDDVATSPTYRARETARLLGFAAAAAVDALGDGGQSMQAVADTQAAWLRDRVTHVPARGNTLLVTHMPNISRAFPQWGAVADGEAVVLDPDGRGGAAIVGRIRIEEWTALQ
jgi:phosphohistidine phosphatase SixA